MKGITPIATIVILVLVVISMAGFASVWLVKMIGTEYPNCSALNETTNQYKQGYDQGYNDAKKDFQENLDLYCPPQKQKECNYTDTSKVQPCLEIVNLMKTLSERNRTEWRAGYTTDCTDYAIEAIRILKNHGYEAKFTSRYIEELGGVHDYPKVCLAVSPEGGKLR